MNTNLKLIKNNQQSVICDGDLVIIESLTIQNQELNEYMKDKEDPVEAFTDLIESALNIRKISNSSAEAEKLGAVAERATTDIVDGFQDATEEFGNLIAFHADDRQALLGGEFCRREAGDSLANDDHVLCHVFSLN